jgi:hypothetical protein
MNKKIKEKLKLAMWGMIVALSFSSCEKDEDKEEVKAEELKDYIYVLNSGLMGQNNASLTMYNVETGVATEGYFEEQNGRKLGDTGQDILVYGSKIYISMSGESTIEVTDLNAKSIKQIKTDGEPRYFTSYEGKIYVTYFNGYVARIDTASFAVETTRVGRNPEQLAVANRKLYVANSGGLDWDKEIGYDKTVSVIDIASFTETKKLDVAINPCNIVVDKQENVYVVSKGNYADVPVTLQKIDSRADAVSALDVKGVNITILGDTLYMIYTGYDENWNPKNNYYLYNVIDNRSVSDNFVGNTVFSADPYQISSDKASDEIYIMTSDYISTGDVYVFDKDVKFSYRFEAGLNPMKAVKIKK